MKKLILGLFLIASACSSNPDIPDDDKARDYRSTKHDDVDQSGDKSAKKEEAADSETFPKAIGPVATIDGKPIEAAEYNKEMDRIAATGMMMPAQVRTMAVDLVERLVDQKLLEGAVTSAGVKITDAQVDDKLKEIREQYAAISGGNEAGTLETLTKQLGISEAELRESIQQTLALEKVLAKRGLKDPATKDVKKLYEDNLESFTQPEQVKASHILFKVAPDADEKAWTETQTKATNIAKQAKKKGADFGALAKEHSEDLSAQNGGDLGFFPRNMMVKEFEDAAFKMKKGTVSDPIRSQFGWHIIKVTDKREAGPVPFEEVEETLSQQLKQNETQKMLGEYIKELREKHKIEIFDANIK